MAMVDYGAIAWKDGKLISTDMFTPMEDMVGWTDNGKYKLEGNYFAYIGDKDLVIGFYKSLMYICYCSDDGYIEEPIWFGWENFKGWHKWKSLFSIGDDEVEIIVRPRKFHDYYICTMKYRGHKYKVAFGYGVDLAYYKKTHIIDYYGTPWFRVKDWCRDIKYAVEDWRYRNGF